MIASGSSAIEMSKATHDLSRRSILTYMYGLSFREYLELRTGSHVPRISLSDLIDHHETIAAELHKELTNWDPLQEFNRYQRVGYYPYHIEFTTESLFF